MKLTTEQIEQVRELVKTKNVHQVHKITGISHYHIDCIIAGKMIISVTDAEIIAASEIMSMSYREIAATFKCSYSRVSQVLANRINNDFNRYKPLDMSGNFSLETMGEPF